MSIASVRIQQARPDLSHHSDQYGVAVAACAFALNLRAQLGQEEGGEGRGVVAGVEGEGVFSLDEEEHCG